MLGGQKFASVHFVGKGISKAGSLVTKKARYVYRTGERMKEKHAEQARKDKERAPDAQLAVSSKRIIRRTACCIVESALKRSINCLYFS